MHFDMKNALGQYYTNPNIAGKYYKVIESLINLDNYELQLEPSAGTGSFFNLMDTDKRVGLDIDPKYPGIECINFFDYQPLNKSIITIGNPPFGKNASLAVKFFNRAATFSQVICFIVPKSFKKDSIQNKLNLNFWLLFEEDLPKNSFVYDGKAYHVPCCFQIWEKREEKRQQVIIDLKNDIFEFVKKNQKPDLAVRRVGGTTGKAHLKMKDLSESSHYFLKVKNKMNKEDLAKLINGIDFNKIINSTAGIKSLSKHEFVKMLMVEYEVQNSNK
jgi:predicted RNA methylase